ncbi:hypothetical protein ACL2XP_21975 [Sodalis sp. RH21]|uniref:hypothetical protein n=1 Tax=unclassified Sodalis (in: enterobacteria) TaxID=2636512 RepID=UPI0039B5E431
MISLNNELANNQYPPLFDYWSKGQFGYSWQLFYPPLTSLLFLIASALTFNSPDIIIQMKTVFFIIMVIAFAASFYAARREHNSVPAGYLCAFLFISSGYFLTDIYIRFALGECLAMAVMPLFLRGCSSLISDREDRWLIPFSALMIFLSNIPSLIVTAIFFILFFIINFKALLSKDNVRFFIISALFVLSLSAFYWVPLLYHMHYSDIFATSGKLLKYEDLLKFSSGLIETLLSLPSTYGVSNPGMFLSVGVIQLILALFYLKYGRSPYAKKMIIVALVFIFATTHFIPWNLIPDSVPILKLMQFPWRLLSCATAIVALYTSGMLADQLPRKRALVFAVVLLSIAGMYLPVKKAVTHRFLQLDTSSLYDDYLNNSNIRPVNFRHLEKNDFAFFVNKQAPIVSTRFVNGYPELQIRADGEQVATLPYIMYSGYYLLVDGKPTDTVRLDNGLVGVRLGAGEHTVRLAYRRSIVIIPGLVSLLSLGVTAFFFSRRRRPQASAVLAE